MCGGFYLQGICRRSFHVQCVKSNENALRATVKASPALQDRAAAVPMLLHLPPTPSIASESSLPPVGAEPAPPRGIFAGVFDFSRDDWRCSSCVTGEHECCMCGVSGQEGVSVFRCSRMCGKYFHIQCLAKNPLTQWLTPAPVSGQASLTKVPLKITLEGSGGSSTKGSSNAQLHAAHGVVSHALSAIPLTIVDRGSGRVSSSAPQPSLELQADPITAARFVCPFHTCSGCLQPFNAFHPPLYYRCHACPTAYHVSCVPQDTRLDMVCAFCVCLCVHMRCS